MGCGSMLGDLFYLADHLVQPSRGPAASPWQAPSPAESTRSGEDLLSDLYRLLGEGQISQEVFSSLRALADRGQLRRVDVAVHQARGRRRNVHREDTGTQNALQGIRLRQQNLAEARKESERVLTNLRGRIADIDERMAGKENIAREAVGEGDDQIARRRLTEKAQLSSLRDRLHKQLQRLAEDLGRLDEVRAELEAREVELEAVRAREGLASLGSVEGASGKR